MRYIKNGNFTKNKVTCSPCCSGKCASAPPQQVTELKRRRFAKSSNTFFSFFSHVPPTRRRELQAWRDAERQSTLDACFRVTNAHLLWPDFNKRAVPLLDLGSFKWVYLWTSCRPAVRAALLCRAVFRCRRWCGMTAAFYFHLRTQYTPPPRPPPHRHPLCSPLKSNQCRDAFAHKARVRNIRGGNLKICSDNNRVAETLCSL